MIAFPEVFATIARREVRADDVRAAFEAILSGAWTPVQIGAFAAALRVHGENASFIGAAAAALREVMTPVEHAFDEVLDTCGTGGDGAHTLNVSTGAAIVAAACGATVAKHGNRSVSSKCGSADVVKALGIPIDLDPSKQRGVLEACGIAFLMAPAHHPALRHAATARQELGIRTIFNALGPLVNPARATHQLVGVYDDGLRPIMAAALGAMGVKRAWVVRSEDGLDEVSPSAPTKVSVFEDGAIRERTITPEDFGAECIDREALAGGDADANAARIESLLRGEAHPAHVAVALNAAAAMVVLRNHSPRDAFAEAVRVMREGVAHAKLEAWRKATRA